MILQPHTSQPIWQFLWQSERVTKDTNLSLAMLIQEKEVRHVEPFNDKPHSYQETINFSEHILWKNVIKEKMFSLEVNNP